MASLKDKILDFISFFALFIIFFESPLSLLIVFLTVRPFELICPFILSMLFDLEKLFVFMFIFMLW